MQLITKLILGNAEPWCLQVKFSWQCILLTVKFSCIQGISHSHVLFQRESIVLNRSVIQNFYQCLLSLAFAITTKIDWRGFWKVHTQGSRLKSTESVFYVEIEKFAFWTHSTRKSCACRNFSIICLDIQWTRMVYARKRK